MEKGYDREIDEMQITTDISRNSVKEDENNNF